MYCECGCGQKTRLAPRTTRPIGWVKGQPIRFVHGHQSRKPGPKYEEVDLGYQTPCWLFTGYVSKKGYGLLRPHGGKRMHPAHRVFYEQAKGPIPPGKQLDHLCHSADPSCPSGSACMHRRCVNPDHLEPVTGLVNSERGHVGKRAHPKPRPRPTHCKHGHEFTPENTIWRPDGMRCHTCQKAAMRAYYHRHKNAGGRAPKRPTG